MARSRNIKPGFFRNEVLVGLPFEYRLLFIGLWTVADRAGRFEDRPTRIKMELFPGDNVDVDAGLQALHDNGFITRYSVDGCRFCQVIAWCKHQNPHLKEAASTIPAPDAHGTSPMQAPGEHGTSPADSLIPDSLNLIPDSRTLEQQAARSTANRFDQFWSVYPVKKGRAKALAKWKASKLDAIADRIIADVKRRKAEDRQWLDGYAPHGSTYVNGRGWEDEIEQRGAVRGAGSETPDYAVGAV